jgi:uncharacterized protein (TIGR02594 family)
VPVSAKESKPSWLIIAEGERGTSEVQGGENPRIIEYHTTTTLKAKEDEVSWCSSFVNWCMVKAGIKGTGLANARSWLAWGEPLTTPRLGCVVIFERGTDPAAGHVAFFIDDLGDRVKVLGGNQSDQVKYSNYPRAHVLGYRWPKQ